jgi:predicted nucleic acid-binding protein
MILADTSVWVDHFRRRNAELAGLLADGLILGHEFVTGELACGQLGNLVAMGIGRPFGATGRTQMSLRESVRSRR